MGLARGLEILFHRRQLIANLRESVTLAQARCCGGLGTGGNGETIPTPKRSIAADKTLSFSKRRVQIAADFGRLDDADGGKPPCERRWAFNERREGFRTLRQRCRRIDRWQHMPMDRRCSIDWRCEVVIERGA